MEIVEAVSAVRLVGELMSRLADAKVLKHKAKRLRSYLGLVEEELKRMKVRRGVAVEIERVLLEMRYVAQQLEGQSAFARVLSVFASRKHSTKLDELEIELRRLVEGYQLAQQNDIEAKLDAIVERLAQDQASENELDLPEDIASLHKALLETVHDEEVGEEAKALQESLAGLSAGEIDRELRRPISSSRVHKTMAKLAATISRTKMMPMSGLQASDVEVDERTVLGRGAFGLVLLGRWKDKTVAVKRCHLAQKKMQSEMQQSMLAEAQHWKTLDHANIVKLFGHCIKDSSVLLVIEKCDLCLEDLIHDSEVDLSAIQQNAIVIGIARGLAYLHSNSVLHRDVKPANVLMSHALGKVKLTDFGLATVKNEAATLAGTSAVRGSWPYMAPEVLEEPAHWSTGADMYAFAITVWEVVVRERPWGTAGAPSIARQVQAGERLPFGEDVMWTNRLQKVVQSCWTTDFRERFTAKEVVRTLEAAGRSRRSTKIIQGLVKLVRPSVSESGKADSPAQQTKKRSSNIPSIEGVIAAVLPSRKPSLHAGVTRVRVKKSVHEPRYGWGSASHQSEGVVKTVISADVVLVNFPEQSDWRGLVSELEVVGKGGDLDVTTVTPVHKFKIGDAVRVKATVKVPVHKWGAVSHASVGVVKVVGENGTLKVNFPEQDMWTAEASEMELVLLRAKAGDRVKLSNPRSNLGVLGGGAIGVVEAVEGGAAPFRVVRLGAGNVKTGQTHSYAEKDIEVVELAHVAHTSNSRLTVGDRVRLAQGASGGCLQHGATGVIVQDDHDTQPYMVHRLDAKGQPVSHSSYWYRESEVVAARPRVGDFVCVASEYEGPRGILAKGEIGVVLTDDSSSVPFRVAKVNSQGEQTGATYWYTEGAIQVAPPHIDKGGGALLVNGQPHPWLAVGVRVSHSTLGSGTLIGFKHQGVRTGDTSGGLSSDNFARVKFDKVVAAVGSYAYNVNMGSLVFERKCSSGHSLRDYVETATCPSCHYLGPSSSRYTGARECSECRLCETCCSKTSSSR